MIQWASALLSSWLKWKQVLPIHINSHQLDDVIYQAPTENVNKNRGRGEHKKLGIYHSSNRLITLMGCNKIISHVRLVRFTTGAAHYQDFLILNWKVGKINFWSNSSENVLH